MRLFILFNSVFHACALKNSYVYFKSIRGAWIAAECTWIRCSAQKTEGTIGISWRLSMNVAWSHIFSCLRAKVGFCNFCAQTGKNVLQATRLRLTSRASWFRFCNQFSEPSSGSRCILCKKAIHFYTFILQCACTAFGRSDLAPDLDSWKRFYVFIDIQLFRLLWWA